MAFPIHDIAASRVGGCLPKAGAGFQLVSGVGVILVGACGPEEMMPVHLAAAIMGFGGSGIAQIIYGIVFMHEDTQTQPQSARTIFIARCIISALFLSSFGLFVLAHARPHILPQPCEHIFEWCMWFTLLGWYFTFRWDLQHFQLQSTDASAHGQV